MFLNSKKWLQNKWLRMILPAILFILTFFFYLVQADFHNLPVLYADSSSYLHVAMDLMRFTLPDTLIRTPVYPLLIWPFLSTENLLYLIVFQMILASSSVVFLYFICLKFTKSIIFSLIAGSFCILDFNYFQFQYIILAELPAAFILSGLIYFLQFFLETKGNINKSQLAAFIIFSLLLIFIKPAFVFLPVMLSLVMLVYILWLKEKTAFFRKKMTFLFVQIAFCLLFVFAWAGMNYARYGFFTMTRLSRINLLSKTIQYGYLAHYSPRADDPEVVRKACLFIKENPSDGNPFPLIFFLEGDKKISDNLQNARQFEQVSYFFMKRNPAGFIRKTVVLSFNNIFELKRNYYVNVPRNLFLQKIFDFGMKYKHMFAWLSLLNLFILLYYYLKKQFGNFFFLFSLIMIVYYVVFINGLTWFEYSRLIAPAELLQDILILFPLYFIIRLILAKREPAVANETRE